MVKNLFIFVFKTCAIFITLSFLFLFLFHFIIQKSNFRLNKIFTDFQIKEKNLILGNSRSVILNKELFNDNNIINLSFNEFNGETIIQSLSSLNNFSNLKNKNIFIEISSLISGKINCRVKIYYFYGGLNKNILDKCYKFPLLAKIFFLNHYNSEFFSRIIYYLLFPSLDQKWGTSSKKISENNCKNSQLNNLGENYYKKLFESSEKNIIIKNISFIKKNYEKNNNKIYFFFMPTLNNEEISKNFENLIPEENKVSINKHLESKYFSNCNYFKDRLHISDIGAESIINYFNFYLKN
tara:strand:- start:366 stop:1253 length:888 start_codon:yes stop_codon:yes gene_type:complete